MTTNEEFADLVKGEKVEDVKKVEEMVNLCAISAVYIQRWTHCKGCDGCPDPSRYCNKDAKPTYERVIRGNVYFQIFVDLEDINYNSDHEIKKDVEQITL